MSTILFCHGFCIAHPVVFIILFSLFLVQPIGSNPRANLETLICGNKTASPNEFQSFKQNYILAISSVSSPVLSSHFVDRVDGNGNSSTVFLFAQCMKDVLAGECQSCLNVMLVDIQRCHTIETGIRAGRVYLGGCFLRYDDHRFHNETTSSDDLVICGQSEEPHPKFLGMVNQLLSTLSSESLKNRRFYLGSIKGNEVSAYVLAQCWEYLDITQCRTCLIESAVPKAKTCLPRDEASVLNVGCYLKYSNRQFYNQVKTSTGFRYSLNGGVPWLSFLLTLAFLRSQESHLC